LARSDKRAPPEQAVFDKLVEVRRERAPYRELTRRVVESTLERFPPLGDGPILEIGAGDGQLRELLPEHLRARLVHTEPTVRGVAELRRRFPDARIEKASVSSLPFADGEIAMVIGLCVLDIVDDLAAAARELARVLAPGAPVIHFLDQSPFLKTVFERLLPLGLVPLPNLFEDPSATHWPQDLLMVESAQLAQIAAVLAENEHPVAAPLEHYRLALSGTPLRVERAILEFDQLAGNKDSRALVGQAIRDAYELCSPRERGELGELRGHLVSSAKELAARLQAQFAHEGLFRVDLGDMTTAWEIVRGEGAGATRYASLAAGQYRLLRELPGHTLAEPRPDVTEGELLRELAVLIFVATSSRG
jgi:SAM-dependent methyltransferase